MSAPAPATSPLGPVAVRGAFPRPFARLHLRLGQMPQSAQLSRAHCTNSPNTTPTRRVTVRRPGRRAIAVVDQRPRPGCRATVCDPTNATPGWPISTRSCSLPSESTDRAACRPLPGIDRKPERAQHIRDSADGCFRAPLPQCWRGSTPTLPAKSSCWCNACATRSTWPTPMKDELTHVLLRERHCRHRRPERRASPAALELVLHVCCTRADLIMFRGADTSRRRSSKPGNHWVPKVSPRDHEWR